MSSWDHPPSTRPDSPREFLVSVELYVSVAAATALRKPPNPRKKNDKREPNPLAGPSEEGRKVKEKSSWISLPRSNGTGHWRPATCKLSEEGDQCLLNIYVDETILYQTVYIHLLNHTDIRQADNSLFFQKDCLGIYCATGQRWSSTHTADPVYLQFVNLDACNTWLALMRSYAVPEVYGRWFFPAEGGSYRMWRQVDLTVVQGRNLGITKPFAGVALDGVAAPEADSRSEPEAVDLDVFCEIQLNDILCGRTTVKKGIGSPDWHESFTFSDVPPFENLDIIIWREKKLSKPAIMGSVRVTLSNFRRGETVEGWFPVLHNSAGLQVGDIRLKIRVDEEIILPNSAYSGLLETFNSRNFLDWMIDFESKLRLGTVSTQLMSIAVAKNVLIEQVFDLADREVERTPASQNTLFRGNTTLTKIMELCMSWYGKVFLEASIGSVLRRLCAEKVAIEVDPARSGKSAKEIEKGVEQLIYWAQEFWKQIYDVRTECPHEMRRLFEHLRKLVEQRYQIDDTTNDQKRELPWQSVSAFCFLRFIVPAILHPHLFGLCPGLPSAPVQRSLTLVAKVIQSLANLNSTVQKEEFMRGVKTFLQDSIPAMIDYILVVSTPVSDPYNAYPGHAATRHDRLNVVNSLRQRGSGLPVLYREAIPLLPHLLDIPRHLAVITSAVIRNAKDFHHRTSPRDPEDAPLDDFCAQCFEVERRALQRVSQLATRSSAERRQPSLSNLSHLTDTSSQSSPQQPGSPLSPVPGINHARNFSTESPIAQRRPPRKFTRPSTAPSAIRSELSRSRDLVYDASILSSPLSSRVLFSRVYTSDTQPDSGDQGTLPRRERKTVHPSSLSAESVSSPSPDPSRAVLSTSVKDAEADTSDDGRRKKGLLRGILTRR